MHPVLFSSGPLHIYSYGAMVSLGIFISVFLLRKYSQAIPVSADTITDLAIATVAGGFIGARIFYIAQFWDYFKNAPLDMFKIWEGGIVFYGGVIGAFIGFGIFTFLKKIPFLKSLDLFVCVISLSHAFGRVGCFLNGCCYGKPSEVPWAIQFPFLNHAVHPTQLYEAFFCFVLAGFLFWLWQKKLKTGTVTAAYFILYPIGRFIIEFYRGDKSGILLNLTLQQWISVLSILLVLFFVFVYGKKRNHSSS